MNEITLHKLTCNESQEDVDECLLEVYLDGSTVREPYPLTQSMSSVGDATDEWEINRTYLFDTEIRVSLFEEDLTESTKDTLGTSDVALVSGGSSVSFTEDGADYTLTYSMTVLEQSEDPSMSAIFNFEESNESVGWRDRAKSDIIDELRILVDRTDSNSDGVPDAVLTVHQMGTPFCGPAAIMVSMAWRFPRRLVECCRAIWEKGYFLGRETRVEASTELRQSKSSFYTNGYSSCKAPSVCWMFLATVRDDNTSLSVGGGDDEDWVMTDFPGNVNQLAYMNAPSLMSLWLFQVAGFGERAPDLPVIQNVESRYLTPAYTVEEALRDAGIANQNGGVGILLVDSNITDPNTTNSTFPNHWVTFLNDAPTISGGKISFDCQTWGRSEHVSKSSDTVEEQVWGVLTAEP